MVILRWALSTVFAVAAAAKLTDARGFRATLRELGLHAAVARPLSLAVSIAEIATASALVSARWASLGGWLATGLLAVFSAVAAVVIARRRVVRCRCFGPLESGPLGGWTIARNTTLAVVALAVALGPVSTADTIVPGRMVFDGRALWLGVTLPGLALFVLRPVARRRHRARTVRRFPATAKRRREPRTGPTAIPALPIGATVPRFSLPALSGGEVALDALLEAGRPVLLVFVSPGCRRCRGLARNLAAWQRRHHADATIGVISRGDVRAHTWFAAMGVTNILVQRGWEVATAYGVRRTPAAVLVAADGTVASGLVGDEGGMAELLAVASRHRSRSGVEYSGLGATTRGPTIVA